MFSITCLLALAFTLHILPLYNIENDFRSNDNNPGLTSLPCTNPKALGIDPETVMATPADQATEQVAKDLLSKAGLGLNLISCKVLQSLWAGYGHICQVRAEQNCQPVSFILKHINPPTARTNGNLPNEGHIRKILSYQVEQYFYTQLAPQMPEEISVATCLSSASPGSQSDSTAMLLSDLRQSFPVAGEKRAELNETQVYAALEWLASFHGFWWTMTAELKTSEMVRPPLEHFEMHQTTALENHSVWLNGGYTYLATRRGEYDSLASDTDSEWSEAFCTGSPSRAERVAEALSPLNPKNDDYTTLIHGDVKSENLFSTTDGKAVVFYDFQYVGLGLGVCDLAKLFTCSVPEGLLFASKSMLEGEEKLLRFYHAKLEQISGKKYPWDTFISHWEFALLDWLRFQASWGMWGNTEWLEQRCRGILEG